MKLSVAICTWNRARLLRQTLEQMTRLRCSPALDWELLVVNNNSTDGTDETVASYRERLPIRLLFEPRSGKSHALNRAVGEARGDYILFTDDDVLVDQAWLTSYCAAFRQYPDASVFGGPIHPWFEGEPPDWLRRTFHRIEYAFAALDLGAEPRPLGGHDVPFGANMAVRTAEHRKYRYDPALGPRPGSGLRGEEITLVKQMLADGHSGWWVPEARVRHFVPRSRQTLRYVAEWYAGWGQFVAQQARGQHAPRLLGQPRWVWRELVASTIRYGLSRAVRNPEVWIEDLKRMSVARGHLAHRPAGGQIR